MNDLGWKHRVKRRLAAAILLLTLIISNISVIFAAEPENGQDNTIIIEMYPADGFAYVKEDKSIGGYAAEYLARIGNETGYNIQIVLSKPGELLTDLNAGKCDLILSCDKYNAENHETETSDYLWSEKSLISEHGILYVTEDVDICYNETDKFNGLNIGICRNTGYEYELESYAQECGFSYTRTYFDSYDKLIEAIYAGEVEAAFMGDRVYVNKKLKNIAVIGMHEYFFMGNAQSGELIRNLDNSISLIESKNGNYLTNLRADIYWDSKAGYPCLTRDETEYVQNHPTVKVGYFKNSYPLQYTDDNGNFAGIVRQMFDYYALYTGLNFEYCEYTDSKKCENDLHSGKIDLIALVPEYSQWSSESGIVLSRQTMKVPYYQITADVTDKIERVGICSYFVAENYKSALENIEVIAYDTAKDCLNALKNGEVDIIFINEFFWMCYSDKAAYSMLHAERTQENYASYMVASLQEKGDVTLIELINSAIDSMPQALENSITTRAIVFSEERKTLLTRFFTTYRFHLFLILTIFIAGIISWIAVIKRKRGDMLEKLAYTDNVTGRANQSKFYIEAEKKIKYKDKRYAIGFVNIGNFKYINDFYGRNQGDNVLNVMAHVLEDMVLPDGIFARLSADRFAFLVTYIDYQTLKYTFENYAAEVDINISGFSDVVTIKNTCGIYLVKDDDTSIQDMVDKAAIAEKKAKSELNVSCMLYDDEMNMEFVKNQQMTANMKKALLNEEFQVYLQPKVDIETEKPVGCEALIRWISPEKGFIPVGDFVPLFEKNGFITEIDFYVLEKVCSLLRRRIDNNLPVFPINVNQSRLHVNDRMYLSLLQDMLNKYDIPMGLVVFEITESAFIDDQKEMINLINRMKNLGFQFSMDDFGSGYSSFNLLKDMPVDELKIDKEFLESTEDSERSKYIIERIVQMAHGLDIRVVCEGVESIEQVNFLKEIECDIIQGYYYSKPMPMEQFEQYLKQFEA